MTSRPWTPPGAVLVLVALSACTGTGPDVDGSWELVEGEAPSGAVPLVEDAPITLTIEDDELSGTAACNSYGGTADLDDERFRAREVFQTEMACDPAEVMDSESAYLEAFRQVTTYERRDDVLVLRGADVELVYERASG